MQGERGMVANEEVSRSHKAFTREALQFYGIMNNRSPAGFRFFIYNTPARVNAFAGLHRACN